jgi:hypothetical protein
MKGKTTLLRFTACGNQGCLWGEPPARLIDLRARPIRVKEALTDRPW